MPRSWWTWEDNPHTIDEAINTVQAFGFGSILVQGSIIDCKELKGKIDTHFFFIMSGFMKTLCIPLAELRDGIKLTHLLTDVGLTSSNAEATQKIKEGSIKVNTAQMKDPRKILLPADLFENRWFLLQKGKGDAAIAMFWEE